MRGINVMSAIVLALMGAAAAAQDGMTEREPDTPPAARAQEAGGDRDAVGDESSAPNDGTTSGEEIVRDEGEGEAGDDDFTPSTRISEDLSVSFPTDI